MSILDIYIWDAIAEFDVCVHGFIMCVFLMFVESARGLGKVAHPPALGFASRAAIPLR